MASKMKKTKKQRTHKTSSRKAKNARIAKQNEQTKINIENGFKPWDKVCVTRTAIRIKLGKPAQWRKRQEAAAKYKTKGKEKVPA